MNSFAYHIHYLKTKEHSLALLNKMYPLPLINRHGKLNYDIRETPLFQDISGIGWDKYMRNKEEQVGAKKWKKLIKIK